MELLLKDGAYFASNRGGLERVTVNDEVKQRILMRLIVPRGEYLPMPDYGSRLRSLHLIKPANRRLAAMQYITEALRDETDILVEDLEITETERGAVNLHLVLRNRLERFTLDL
jgi:phage baseplate assembly protein W